MFEVINLDGLVLKAFDNEVDAELFADAYGVVFGRFAYVEKV